MQKSKQAFLSGYDQKPKNKKGQKKAKKAEGIKNIVHQFRMCFIEAERR